MASRVLDVLVANGSEHVMVVHGDDGLAELTTTTTSQVWEYEAGERHHYSLDATELGLPRVASTRCKAATPPRMPRSQPACSRATPVRRATSRC